MSELLSPGTDLHPKTDPLIATTVRVSQLPSGGPEIFESIQGEGPSAGRPSVFLRLAYCNLRCSWCDTRYTWDWQNYDPQREVSEYSIAQLDAALNEFESENLVLTGGEPLLQQDRIEVLLERQSRRGRRIEVETNGTILPTLQMEGLVNQWNVSPKLENSGETAARRRILSVLDAYRKNERAFFKFAIQSPSDVIEVEKLASDRQ